MTTKKLLTAVSLLCLSLAIGFAQGPNGSKTYYQAANGKKGAALKTALHNKIKISSAGWSYDGLKTAYKTTDTRSDGKLRDWYSNATSYEPGSNCASSYKEEGDGYNREHLVPQSWFSKSAPMVSDIWHVVPSDAKINGERGDKPLGEVGTSYSQSKNGYSKWGTVKSGLVYKDGNPINSLPVFEPNDEVKGDIARAYFYMVTCYENKISNWNSSANASYVFDGNTYPGLTQWCLDMMMRWSELDPVDDIEIARNNVIAATQNRNPFIDYPGLEEYIWGEWQDVEFSYDNYVIPYEGETPTTVSTPTFSLAGGTYTTEQTVTISCATSGATIYYTTNGSKPSTSSTKYNAAITISETTTLKAIAIKDGTESSVASATYTINTGGGDEPTPSGETLLWESFSRGSNISDSGVSLNTSNLSNYCDYTGWSTLTQIYADPGNCGRVGSSKNQGSLVANNIVLTGDAILTYKIKNYNKDSGKTVNVSISGASATGDLTATGSSEWVEHTVNITGATGSISLSFSGGRIAIDDIKLVAAGQTPATLLGDVNGDGEVTIADVTALVNILLGKDTAGYDLDAADVNSDGGRTIADVVALVKMILTK